MTFKYLLYNKNTNYKTAIRTAVQYKNPEFISTRNKKLNYIADRVKSYMYLNNCNVIIVYSLKLTGFQSINTFYFNIYLESRILYFIDIYVWIVKVLESSASLLTCKWGSLSAMRQGRLLKLFFPNVTNVTTLSTCVNSIKDLHIATVNIDEKFA